MKLLFITATNTNIGKTFATSKLIRHFSKQGLTVGVCKPIETGFSENRGSDANKLLLEIQKYNKKFRKFKPKDITAYTFPLPASPFCADVNSIIKIENIKHKIKNLSSLCDLLIIEGAGGLKVPIKKNYMMLDLIQDLNVKTLLITPSRLGCINETLLSIEALTNRNIDFEWCVNLFEDKESFDEVTKPFYDAYFQNWWYLQDKSIDLVGKLIGV